MSTQEHNTEGVPPMDVHFLLEQVGGSAAVAKMVIEEFVLQAPSDRSTLETLLSQGDWAAASKVAHGLKGACGVFGAAALRMVVADLEIQCRDGDVAAAARSFAAVCVEIDRCMDFLPSLEQQLG